MNSEQKRTARQQKSAPYGTGPMSPSTITWMIAMDRDAISVLKIHLNDLLGTIGDFSPDDISPRHYNLMFSDALHYSYLIARLQHRIDYWQSNGYTRKEPLKLRPIYATNPHAELIKAWHKDNAKRAYPISFDLYKRNMATS